jgi:hypothetical protein
MVITKTKPANITSDYILFMYKGFSIDRMAYMMEKKID